MVGSTVLGITSFLILFNTIWITLYVRQERIVGVVLFAYVVRCIAYAAHRLLIPDLYTERLYPFERFGWEISLEGFGYVAQSFSFGPELYTWLIGVIYLVFPRSSMLISSINIFMGAMVVYIIYKIVVKYTDHVHAKRAAVLASLLPVLVLQSIILSRESFIIFFLAASCLALVNYSQFRRYRYFIYGIILLLAASAPHTGLLFSSVIALLLVSLYVLIYRIRKLHLSGVRYKLSRTGILSSFSILVIGLIVMLSSGTLRGILSGAKISSFFRAEDPLSPIYARYDSYSGGAADYPNWISPASLPLMILVTPLQAAYFLFSPFVWMVSEIRHIFGLINGLIILFLTYNITYFFRSKVTSSNMSMIFISLFVFSFIVVFSIAVNNFGQAYRHRTKILPLLISFGMIGFASKPK
jgi:hypothetical protein